MTKTISDKIFSYPSCSICSRTIDFCRIFARKSTTSMSSPTPIGICNDLTACETRISCWSSNDESVAWIENKPGVDQPFFRYCRFYDKIEQIFPNLLVGDFRIVLGRDKNRMNSNWSNDGAIFFVLHSNLNFSIRAHPRDNFFLSTLFHSSD